MREIWNGFQTWMRDDKGFARSSRTGYLRRVQQAHRWLRHNGYPGIHLATEETLRAWWDSITASPQNRAHARSALLAFFSYVNDKGWRPDNPAGSLPKLRIPRGLPRPVPNLDVVRLFDAASTMGPKMEAIVALLVFCGLRNAELRSLQWTDVRGDWLRVVGKGSKERRLPIPPDAQVPLARWRGASTSVQWVFPSSLGDGRQMSETGLSGLFDQLEDAAGIGHLTPHMLRHTYATELLEVSGDITVVQQGLGHSSPATSMIYAQVNPARLEEASRKLHFG